MDTFTGWIMSLILHLQSPAAGQTLKEQDGTGNLQEEFPKAREDQAQLMHSGSACMINVAQKQLILRGRRFFTTDDSYKQER